jgi:hypothetical protein
MPRNTADQVQIVTRVAPALRERLKAHAAIEGLSMNEVVTPRSRCGDPSGPGQRAAGRAQNV